MLGSVKKFFEDKIKGLKNTPIDYTDAAVEAKRAVCAILMELASIDGEFLHTELKELANSLQEKFNLSKEELAHLVDMADAEIKASENVGQFTDLVNKHFNEAQKYGVMVMVWQVIMADGKLEKKEERFAKQMMSRLQLSQELMDKAREEAQK